MGLKNVKTDKSNSATVLIERTLSSCDKTAKLTVTIENMVIDKQKKYDSKGQKS